LACLQSIRLLLFISRDSKKVTREGLREHDLEAFARGLGSYHTRHIELWSGVLKKGLRKELLYMYLKDAG
jgi:hypothetical protein